MKFTIDVVKHYRDRTIWKETQQKVSSRHEMNRVPFRYLGGTLPRSPQGLTTSEIAQNTNINFLLNLWKESAKYINCPKKLAIT